MDMEPNRWVERTREIPICKKYASLFDECYDFSIGKGWLPLIEGVCDLIESEIKEMHAAIERASKIEAWKGFGAIAERELAELKKAPFKIVQVKEKFGCLNINVHNGLQRWRHYIRLAETVAHRICEDCGRRAEVRTTGWVRTLCRECAETYLKKRRAEGRNDELRELNSETL